MLHNLETPNTLNNLFTTLLVLHKDSNLWSTAEVYFLASGRDG